MSEKVMESRGGSRIFFTRGCTRLLLYFNTNKPHSFFCRIPVVLENCRSSQGGGGAHPLHPPPRSAPGKSWNLKTWKLEYNPEGFWCCFVDILNQKLISVSGASYYYYSRERGVGNEHREWEIEKWEQKQRIGNKVTDRARVQVRLCSIFHFPRPCAHSPF